MPPLRHFLPFAGIFGLILAFAPAMQAEKVSVVSIKAEELVEFETASEPVKKLIRISLELTEKKLGYQFGSNSPDNWGMDCSGTVQSTLTRYGFEGVPRSSWDFYTWAEKAGVLKPTPGVTSTEDPVFADLKPGDLLFWEGTYETGKRDPPISHVMIYLGTLKADGKGVMFGASSGRRYRGKTIHGVSVFDWEVPKKGSESTFVGYASIPGFAPEEPKTTPEVEANVLKSLLDHLFKKSEVSQP